MTGPATLGVAGRLGYRITTPESWFEVDVHPGTRDRSIRQLVEDRAGGVPEMWAQRHAITRLLGEQATAAYAAGATFCSVFAMPSADAMITGSVVVSLVRGPVHTSTGAVDADGGADGLGELDRGEHLAGLFRSVPRGRGEFDPYTMVGTAEIETCPTAARAWGIADVEAGTAPTGTPRGPRTVRTVFMQTAVPVPRVNKVFLVSASSPCVSLAEALYDVFDAVTGTFRLVDLGKSGDVGVCHG
ncbi:MAG: hypothetical protein ACRCYU_17680 [Nocardioides sp.]